MGRAPCCDKDNVKRGPWSPEEDAKLKSYIETNGTGGNWIALPHKIGLKRCGKSCRLRWLNYLRPNIKHGGFSEEEDDIICNFYLTIGSRWSIIATELPGRTDNDIKNYWNTRLKKKLINKQRKELQEASMGQHEMMLMMTKRQQEVQTMFTWPLHQQVLTYPHDDQLTTGVMNQSNMFSDQEDVKPVIIKNIVKIESDRINPHQHQDSISNGFDNLSFSQLLLDPNNNHIGTGDQCFTTNSILSTSIDQYQNQEQEVLHQWFGNFQTKSFDLFSGTAMGTTTTTTTTTSSSGDQSTISWEELVYSEYKR